MEFIYKKKQKNTKTNNNDDSTRRIELIWKTFWTEYF